MTAETKDVVATEPATVKEFVAQAHRDIDRVGELLQQIPTLVHAAHDWGGGDWETGLGAAAHMGRRDIAEVLLEHGARMDLFAAAMLGHLSIVRSMLTEYPPMLDARGPHGISLEAHAQAGGTEAEHVLDYLRTLRT